MHAELLQRLLQELQVSGGGPQAMEASLRSAIAAAVASTHGQTRLASPGDGPALVLTPLRAQAAAAAVSPASESVLSSAHTHHAPRSACEG